MMLDNIPTDVLLLELARRREQLGVALAAWGERECPELRAAARAWGLGLGDLFQARRDYTRARARWTAWTLLEERGLSRRRIAELFGMDPSAVHHGLRRLAEEVEKNVSTAAVVRRAREIAQETTV